MRSELPRRESFAWFRQLVGTEMVDQRKSRRAQGAGRLFSAERDKGFEPSTFSLGITDETE